MGGSAAESPPPEAQPTPAAVGGLRASDAERDEVATRLKDEFAAGRLSHDTFLYRMNAVYEARRRAELPPLLADLPGQPQAARPLGGRSVAGWFRGVWSRVAGSAADRGGPGAWPRTAAPPAAVVTMGLRAAPELPPPRPLEFPRGNGEQFSIGRDANCDLSIADMTVSRRHATLERTQDGWLLTDLESTNGTRVNGWRVRGKVKVTPGDLVSFGNAEYSLSPAGS
jgi:hypothetical protein